jgi:hypothetical protein
VHRAEQVPAPLPLPPPEGGSAAVEAPLPQGALPEGAWFVRLPGQPDWRTMAWLPEGEAPAPRAPAKAKQKAKQKARPRP